MKKSLLFILCSFLMLAPFVSNANSYVLRQVIVLNEGSFGGPVYVGTYDPASKVYANFDTIPASFASDVIIDGGFIYVAADTLLLKYDLITKQLLHQQTVKGIRELTVYHNLLLVSRGDVAPLPSFFQAYNLSDLSFAYEITTLSGRTSELKVIGDTAYVGVNDFGAMGKLAVIDLAAHTLNREIDLGTDGLNPESVHIEGNKLIVVSSPNYNNTSISKFDCGSTNLQNTLLNTTSSCSGSSTYLNNVYFQVSAESKLKVFNTQSTVVYDSLNTNQTAYGLGIDSVNARIYEGITDFTSFGKVYIFDFYGALKDSFPVNISPGTFAFDVVNTTAAEETQISSDEISVYPVPASDEIFVEVPLAGNTCVQLTLLDITGRMLQSKTVSVSKSSIAVQNLSAGMYFLKCETAGGTVTKKILKN